MENTNSFNRKKLIYRPNVCLIVLKDNKLLVVLKEKNDVKFWFCPGGGIGKEESLEEASKREFKEELGNEKFEISYISKRKHKFEWPESLRKEKGFRGQKQSFVVINFLGNEEDIEPNHEFNEYKFINTEDLDKYIDKPKFLKKINKVINEVNKKDNKKRRKI